MSPTSYLTAPPRTCILTTLRRRVNIVSGAGVWRIRHETRSFTGFDIEVLQ
jgi:hypothetical protein